MRPAHADYISSKFNAAPILACGSSSLPEDAPPRLAQRIFFDWTAVATTFKLAAAADRSWRCLDAQNQLPNVIFAVSLAASIKDVIFQAQADEPDFFYHQI
jgi:hypothetical protein